MSESSVIVYTAATPQEAFLLRDALAEAGIRALVSNESLQAAAGDVPLGWTIAPRLLVAPADAAAARRLAEEYEDRRRSGQALLGDDDLPSEKSVAAACCPDCGRPRTAICPVCGTGGSRFRPGEMVGDVEANSADGPVVLICPICDEPFEPGYLRRCEWCGHEFAEGLPPPVVPAPREVEPVNLRLIAVGALIAAAIAGAIAYFGWVLAP